MAGRRLWSWPGFVPSMTIGFLSSLPRSQGLKKLVELRERLGHPALHPGDGGVESCLRGIEFVHDQQRLASLFLEGHRGDGAVVTFVIGPDEARVRGHFDVPAEKRHR